MTLCRVKQFGELLHNNRKEDMQQLNTKLYTAYSLHHEIQYKDPITYFRPFPVNSKCTSLFSLARSEESIYNESSISPNHTLIVFTVVHYFNIQCIKMAAIPVSICSNVCLFVNSISAEATK